MAAPVLQDYSLTWGVLSLLGAANDGEFEITTMSGETHFGNPVPLIEAMQSLLTDGALAEVIGWDNREVPLRLKLSANDGENLALAEAALVQQVLLAQPPPLVWVGPLTLSAPAAFDTVVAQLDADTSEGWDSREINSGDVFYQLTLTCLPFARAVESTVVPALPVPTDPDTAAWEDIDACDSTSGWSAEASDLDSGPTLATVGSEDVLIASATFANTGQYLRLVRTGAVDMDGLPYLAVDADFSTDVSRPRTGHWAVKFDSGAWITPLSVVRMTLPTGVTVDRGYYSAPATFTTLRIAFDIITLPLAPASYDMAVANLAATDTIGTGTITTSREQSRLVDVAGSMPTNAVVRLYDATPADLGNDIFVYTSRSIDFLPNLRQWIDSSETPASDTSLVSGAHHALGPADTVFLIPASLLTLGTYALLGRLDISVAGTLSWQARMVAATGAATVGSGVVISGSVDLEGTTGYEVLDLAAMILPVVEVEGPGHALELTLTGTADMEIDEAWLFSLDDGALTWIKDTEGLDWIEIRSPELGAARPSVWGGRNAVGTNPACIDWRCESFGAHRFEPGTMQIFTMGSTTLVSQCELEYFPRFHSRVWGQETS